MKTTTLDLIKDQASFDLNCKIVIAVIFSIVFILSFIL